MRGDDCALRATPQAQAWLRGCAAPCDMPMQGEMERGACYAALEVVRRTAKAGVVDHSTYSTVLGRLRPQCPATLEMVSHWFQRELGKARLR